MEEKEARCRRAWAERQGMMERDDEQKGLTCARRLSNSYTSAYSFIMTAKLVDLLSTGPPKWMSVRKCTVDRKMIHLQRPEPTSLGPTPRN